MKKLLLVLPVLVIVTAALVARREPRERTPAASLPAPAARPETRVPPVPTESELAEMRTFFARHPLKKPEAVYTDARAGLEDAARRVREARKLLDELKARAERSAP